MTAKKCPICGKLSLKQKRGEYQVDLPPNISGNTVIVADAEWQHCDSCGEDILSKELEQALAGCVTPNFFCHSRLTTPWSQPQRLRVPPCNTSSRACRYRPVRSAR